MVFIVYGLILSKSKNDKNYWRKALVPIIVYTLIEGLRFGRYIDWNLYYFRYNNLGISPSSEDYEFLFKYICFFLYRLGIPYYLFILLQCCFLITSVFLLLKNFRNNLYFIVPAIIVSLMPNEMFIRWYLAFSFFLVSIHFIINGEQIKAYLFLTFSILTHVGFVIFIPLIIFYNFLNNKVLPPKIGSLIFILTSLFLTLSSLSFIADFSNVLLALGLGEGDDNKINSYLLDTESIISGDWGNVGIMEQSLATRIRSIIAYLPAIYWGKSIMQKYNYGYFIYNLFVLGAIVNPLFQQIEIFNRIAASLTFFSLICCGLYYYDSLKFHGRNPYKLIICLLSLLCLLWPSLMDVFGRPDKYAMFIWDAHGRHFLN